MSKFAALATLAGVVPFSIRDRAPWDRSCFEPEPAGDPPRPDPAPAPKTFSEAEVNGIVEGRLSKLKKELEAATEAAKKLPELEATLAKEREERELLGKTEAEKARLAAEKASAKLAQDREAALRETKAANEAKAAAEAKLVAHIKSGHVSAGLLAAKALPGAIAHAVAIFASEAEIDLDDKNSVTAVRYGGISYATVEKAATEWLKANAHFAQAAPGGTGTRGQGAIGTGGKPLVEMSLDDLLRADAAANRT